MVVKDPTHDGLVVLGLQAQAGDYVEGGVSMEHFIEEYSKTPHIDLVAVVVSSDNFGRHILRGPTEAASTLQSRCYLPSVPLSQGALKPKSQSLRLPPWPKSRFSGLMSRCTSLC